MTRNDTEQHISISLRIQVLCKRNFNPARLFIRLNESNVQVSLKYKRLAATKAS